MRWKVLKKANFYSNFYEDRPIPGIYASIHYADNSKTICSNTDKNVINGHVGTYWVELFPSYFAFDLNTDCTHVLKKIFRVKGYCITIDQMDSVDQYLASHFKPNFRTSMRRRLKGLETCFNVRYKMFYGQIGKDDYDFIMNKLHYMLSRRFDQRNDENMSLHNWKYYYDNTFALINGNKASLYVIYDDQKPIQISLSYHYGKIMFLSIPSYDIDYSKFGLGNISVQKLLEWCIDNAYEMLDMGFGAFDYKVKWCNEIYDFEHHLFYDKSSIISRTLVQLITIKTQLINFLLAKKVNILFHRLKAFFIGKKKSDLIDYRFEETDLGMPDLQKYKKVNPLVDDSYFFLRKAIFDFLYTYLEHVSDIEVYQLENNNSFIVKGLNQIQKVCYEV